jgi:hypothetical protein
MPDACILLGTVHIEHTEFKCFPQQEAGRQKNLHAQYMISKDSETGEGHK